MPSLAASFLIAVKTKEATVQRIPKSIKVIAVIIGVILLIEAGGALMKATDGKPISLVVSIGLVMVYVLVAYLIYKAWKKGDKNAKDKK